MSKHLKAAFAALLSTSLLAATLVQAAEEGGSSTEGHLGEIYKWIHFVILAGILYWVFGKLLPPMFRRKADTISAAIEKATAAKAESDRLLKEAAVKLASLEDEIKAFRAVAQKDAATELERLRATSRLDAEKIGAAALAEIEAAERSARVELKALAAKLAVDGVESQVSKQMTPAVQDALIDGFVRSLQGRPN